MNENLGLGEATTRKSEKSFVIVAQYKGKDGLDIKPYKVSGETFRDVMYDFVTACLVSEFDGVSELLRAQVYLSDDDFFSGSNPLGIYAEGKTTFPEAKEAN